MQERPYRLVNRGFGLLEVFLVAIVLFLLSFLAIRTYLKGPTLDKSTQKTLTEQGIDASSQQAVLESARERIEDYNKQIRNRQIELNNLN